MFEYKYCVDLSISHPDKNLEFLSDLLSMQARKSLIKGDNWVTKDGTNKGTYSRNLWLSQLHNEKYLYSKQVPLEAFLSKITQELSPHKELFIELQDSGYIEYYIGVFSDSGSAITLTPDLQSSISSLGISIGLNLYS